MHEQTQEVNDNKKKTPCLDEIIDLELEMNSELAKVFCKSVIFVDDKIYRLTDKKDILPLKSHDIQILLNIFAKPHGIRKSAIPNSSWYKNFDSLLLATENQNKLNILKVKGSEISYLSFADDDIISFNRIPLKRAELKETPLTPAWENVALRMQTGETCTANSFEFFATELYSLFDPFCERKMSLYIVDEEGNSGKSTIVEAISKYLGGIHVAVKISNASVLNTSSRAETQILNKRLIFIEEAKPAILSSDRFKDWTGGSSIYVDQKFQVGYNASFMGKFILVSNDRPEFEDVGNVKERVAIISISPNATKDKRQKNEVMQEYLDGMPAVLALGKKYYEQRQILIDQLQERFAQFTKDDAFYLVEDFLKEFAFCEQASIDSREIRNFCLNKSVNINYLYRILRKHGYNKFKPSVQKKIEGVNTRKVEGIRRKFVVTNKI
ncbi:viral dsdna helicase [Caudoviricetes sp.]|nr:viral dsdna helicase [Caudoviricetes sp.]